MTLEVIPIGGYKEIGRNSVAIKYEDEVVVLDLGLHMDNYISYTNDERDFVDVSAKKLIDMDTAPNIDVLGDLKKKVKAVCITHAHLDHVGAVPYLSNKFNADIHCTPFTAEVIKAICADEKKSLRNDIVSHKINSRFRVSDNVEVEFIHVTHSTPHTVMIAVHTPSGTALYANDFKLDNSPTMGPLTNVERLKEMEVKVLIMDCLYADESSKTPSEAIAKEMLKEVLFGTVVEGKSIVVTTFSSHIARLKSIVQMGESLGRKVVFLGRSLSKYVDAAEKIGLAKFSDKVEMVRYGAQVKRWLRKVRKPEQYLLVTTGHQGEPNSTLGKMIYQDIFNFQFEDLVIFSSKIIPVEVNIMNREKMEAELKKEHVRIFKDIHVSGHAFKEDHRDMLHMVKPEHIIPTHGDLHKLNSLKELALDIGYTEDKIHIIGNGERVKF